MKNIIFLICILISTAAIADKHSQDRISYKISTLLSNKTDFNKKENRQILATLLIKQLTDLDILIPYNTPAENAWLEKEKSEAHGSTERVINLTSSPIFAKYWLKDRIQYTCELLKENQASGIPLKQETLNWLNISLILMSEYNGINENLSILVRNNTVNKSKLTNLISYGTSNEFIFRILNLLLEKY
ncbi:hypothetical protein PGH42_08435 [Legionella pneumophila]|nr:hypothetical protein PGH42_08435 [Legionella pneumophila]